jgi:hypothetical protein
MTQIDYGRAAGYFLLSDFWKGLALGLNSVRLSVGG